MARLSFSGYLRQAGQGISQAASGFADTLFNAEASSEISKHQYKLQTAADDLLKGFSKDFAASNYSTADDGTDQIGGKSVDDWLSPSGDWYTQQMKDIDQNIKNPLARRKLKEQLEGQTYEIRSKAKTMFENAKIDSVGANTEETLGINRRSTESASAKIQTAKTTLESAVSSKGMTREAAQIRFQQERNDIINDALLSMDTFTKGIDASKLDADTLAKLGSIQLQDLKDIGVDPTRIAILEENFKLGVLYKGTLDKGIAEYESAGRARSQQLVNKTEGLSIETKLALNKKIGEYMDQKAEGLGIEFDDKYTNKRLDIANAKDDKGKPITRADTIAQLTQAREDAHQEAVTNKVNAAYADKVDKQFDSLILWHTNEKKKEDNKGFRDTWTVKNQGYIDQLVKGTDSDGNAVDYTKLADDIGIAIQDLTSQTTDLGDNVRAETIATLTAMQQNAVSRAVSNASISYSAADTNARKLAATNPLLAEKVVDAAIVKLETDNSFVSTPEKKESTRAALVATKMEIHGKLVADDTIAANNKIYAAQKKVSDAIIAGNWDDAAAANIEYSSLIEGTVVDGKPLDAKARENFDQKKSLYDQAIAGERLSADLDATWLDAASKVDLQDKDAKKAVDAFETKVNASKFTNSEDKKAYQKTIVAMRVALKNKTSLDGDTKKTFEAIRMITESDKATDITAAIAGIDEKIKLLEADGHDGYVDGGNAAQAVSLLTKQREKLKTKIDDQANAKASGNFLERYVSISSMDPNLAIEQVDAELTKLTSKNAPAFQGEKASQYAQSWVSDFTSLKGNLERSLAGTNQQTAFDNQAETNLTNWVLSQKGTVTVEDLNKQWINMQEPKEFGGRKYVPTPTVLRNVTGWLKGLNEQAGVVDAFETQLTKAVAGGLVGRDGALKMINDYIKTAKKIDITKIKEYQAYVDKELPGESSFLKPTPETTAIFMAGVNSAIASGKSYDDVKRWIEDYGAKEPAVAGDAQDMLLKLKKLFELNLNNNQAFKDNLAKIELTFKDSKQSELKKQLSTRFLDAVLEGKMEGGNRRNLTDQEIGEVYSAVVSVPIAKNMADYVLFTNGRKSDLPGASQPFDWLGGPQRAASWAGVLGKDKSGSLPKEYDKMLTDVEKQVNVLLKDRFTDNERPRLQMDDSGFWYNYKGSKIVPVLDEKGKIGFLEYRYTTAAEPIPVQQPAQAAPAKQAPPALPAVDTETQAYFKQIDRLGEGKGSLDFIAAIKNADFRAKVQEYYNKKFPKKDR